MTHLSFFWTIPLNQLVFSDAADTFGEIRQLMGNSLVPLPRRWFRLHFGTVATEYCIILKKFELTKRKNTKIAIHLKQLSKKINNKEHATVFFNTTRS
jgi:hypothetical protein